MSGMPAGDEEVRDFFGRWTGLADAGDWAGFAALLDPGVELTDPMSPEPARGREAAVARAQAQYAPVTDARTTVVGDPFVSVGDRRLAYQWRFTGTFARPLDPPGFAPTGRPLRVDGVSVLSFADGLVRTVRMVFDATDVARQIGAAPPAGSRMERAAVVLQRLNARRLRR